MSANFAPSAITQCGVACAIAWRTAAASFCLFCLGSQWGCAPTQRLRLAFCRNRQPQCSVLHHVALCSPPMHRHLPALAAGPFLGIACHSNPLIRVHPPRCKHRLSHAPGNAGWGDISRLWRCVPLGAPTGRGRITSWRQLVCGRATRCISMVYVHWAMD